jgi:hypothetical protein
MDWADEKERSGTLVYEGKEEKEKKNEFVWRVCGRERG